MAGPRCTVCDHAQRKEIDQAYVSGSLRGIAAQFNLSATAVGRHKKQCLLGAVERVSSISKQKLGNDLLKYLQDSIEQLGNIADRAVKAQDFRAAVAAITERTTTTLTTWQLLNPEPKQSSESPKAHYGWVDRPVTAKSDTERFPAKGDSTIAEQDSRASAVQ